MRLFEHADFEQAIIQAAEHFAGQGLRPAIIEKDYYVTEALRSIAAIRISTAGKGNHEGRAEVWARCNISSRLIAKFANEEEGADWWASRQGREFIKEKSATLPKKGRAPKGSRLVRQLDRATTGRIALRLPKPDVAKAREIAARKGFGLFVTDGAARVDLAWVTSNPDSGLPRAGQSVA